MRSGEFMRKANITRDTLRYYNKLGLLRPAINPKNGYKDYTDEQIDVVRRIKSAQSIGFSLSEVSEYQKKTKTERINYLVPYLEAKLKEVNAKIKDFNTVKRHIQSLLDDFHTAKDTNGANNQ